MVKLRPEKAVRLHGDLAPTSGQIAFKNALDRLSVLLPDRLRVGAELYVARKGVGQGQRRVHLRGPMEKAILIVGDKIVEDLLELGLVAIGVKCQARQSLQGLPQKTGVEPGETCGDHLVASAVLLQQIGAMHELLVVGGDPCGLGHIGVELSLKPGRGRQTDRRGEHYRVARLHLCLEMSRDIEILLAREPTAVLVGIGHALVPARGRHEGHILCVELHIQIRESVVEVEGHSVRDLPAIGARVRVLVRQGMDVAEGKERREEQSDLGRRLHQFETDHHLIRIRYEKDAFREGDLADPVGDLRHRISLEINDVLVAARLIDASVAMDAQIEPLPVQDETLIQRGQKQMLLPSESVNRYGQQTMVTPGVASHNRCVAIRSGLVGADDLPLQ